MTEISWHFAENQILNSTKNNFKAMSIFSPDLLARLNAEKSDADILVLYNRYEPIDLAYNTSYTGWISSRGLYKGETARVEGLLSDLSSTKIKEWDVQIQAVHLEGTADYIAILPNRREPFQTGGIDQRIYEVKSLGERLTSYVALAATKTDVDNYHTTLNDARVVQQTKEELVRTKSNELEIQRVAASNMAYGNIGLLMDKYREDPGQIERFFDLSLLQIQGGEPEEPLSGIIAGGDTVNILSEGIEDSTQFVLKNNGDTSLKFCCSDNPTSLCEITGITLDAGMSTTVIATDIGPAGSTCLNVTNLDAGNQGEWEVIVVS